MDQDASLFRKYVEELRQGRKGSVFHGTTPFASAEGETLVSHLSPSTRDQVLMRSMDDLIPLMERDGEKPTKTANDMEEVVQEL